MKVVAFLQNAWFPPDTRLEIICKYISDDRFRRRVLAKGYSGKRIIKIFGEKLFNTIIWNNVSLEVGAKSDHCGKPDLEHVESVVKIHRPQLILAFGKVAENTLRFLYKQDRIKNVVILSTKHPNARHFPDSELQRFCNIFKEVIRCDAT